MAAPDHTASACYTTPPATTNRVRQWTGDQRGWYKNGPPFFGKAGSANVFIYGMLTLAFLLLMIFRGATFQFCSLTGSDRLHRNMLHRWVWAPCSGGARASLRLVGCCCVCSSDITVTQTVNPHTCT
jgi:hypothetical protein